MDDKETRYEVVPDEKLDNYELGRRLRARQQSEEDDEHRRAQREEGNDET